MEKMFKHKKVKLDKTVASGVAAEEGAPKAKKSLHAEPESNLITMTNVDVPSNRKRFREHFEEQVLQFLEKHNLFIEREDDEEESARMLKSIDFAKLSEKQFYNEEF